MMEVESPARLPTSDQLTPHDALPSPFNALAQHTSVSIATALHHQSVLESRTAAQPPPSSSSISSSISSMVVETSSHEPDPATIAQTSSPLGSQFQVQAADLPDALVTPTPNPNTTADDPVMMTGNGQSSESSGDASSLSPPEQHPPTMVDLETGCSNSPRSIESGPEKQRSRRKPTLEDIVRRMKTSESYCSDDSSEEEMMMNGSLTIDMARGGADEVDGGSTDLSCQDLDMRDDPPPPRQHHLSEADLLAAHHERALENKAAGGLPKPQFPPHVIDNLEYQKENHPLLPTNGGLPSSSMPMASNISETAFSPHIYAASKINSWFHGSFNGLPLFPYPPSPMDPSMARKYLPFESKLAAEVEKDYLKCQYCERTFRRQKNLENHIENTHQGKGPVRRPRSENGSDMYFKCTHCPYTTKHQSNLYVHLRIHTGERPYICGACGVQYSQSHSLKSHIINKHDGIMSFYIKEKRNRTPRGISYLASHCSTDFKMPTPPIMSPHMQLQPSMDLSAKTLDLKGVLDNMAAQALPVSKSSPHIGMNGHASPHYADLPHNRSPVSMPQTPTNGHIPGGGYYTPPSFLTGGTPSLLTPSSNNNNNNNNNNNSMSQIEEACGAIDLSKKSNLKQEVLVKSFHDKLGHCFHDNKATCGNCMHGAKLRMLRLNVVRMLSILVPNLNFEEKGISADSDSVDELLQDVIESNTHEEDMAE